MNKKFLKNIEWQILIYSLILLVFGLIGLYSATSKNGLDEFYKQIKWFVISIPFLFIFTVVDYKKLAKFSPIMYIITIIALMGIFFTQEINGAKSWYQIGSMSFQPSELGKVFVILFISYIVSKFQQKGREEINKVHKLFATLFLILLPTGLIILQPDYGTALAYIIAFCAILYISGIGKRYIIPLIVLAVITVFALYNYVLPKYAPHAIRRIEVFLNPGLDPRGDGYNVIQSKIAVGSGYLLGMGIGKGNQTQLGYLYPKTTDFIYALISEELGFVASGSIIIIYILLITKAMNISKTAKDNLGAYIAIGIAGIFLYHMTQNIAMTMGLLPITGIPLPFVSYGGSALITNFICIALLLNISGRRQKAIFVEMRYT